MLIGILQTGDAPDVLHETSGDYPDMFVRLLSGRGFTFRTWRVLDMDFPASPQDADGWLITGSRFGAYEDHAFIPPLEAFIRATRDAGVPMVGVCFGHQIIAQALGGRVEKFAGGWAIGPQDYDFDGEHVTLNAWHQDQVVNRPDGARVIARSAFCENAALMYGDRIFTVQAHPEFDSSAVEGLLAHRGGTVPDTLKAQAAGRIASGGATGQPRLADRIEAFFKMQRFMPDDSKRPAAAHEAWVDRLPEAARRYIEGRRLDEVECIVPDIAGVARGKAMPAFKFVKQASFFLPNSIFLQTITGDWADNPNGAFTEPDMIMVPDFSTATAAPWTADVTLQVIHDAIDQSGHPVPASPRNVLKRVVELYREKGWTPIVAPEMEFFLVARNVDPNMPIEPPMGRSGRRAAAKQAYSMSAVDEYGPVIDDIYDFAEAQGFEIDGILQEGGAGQVEINLAHGDPVRLADEIFFFKRLIREAALRHDCFATFMAKPIEGEPGSAMHIHHSVVDTASGQNIFSDATGKETQAFLHFIAGMQSHLPAAIALIAPYVNSYRRYVPDFAAPINLEWGRDNRTTGLRVPISEPSARRLENRLAGMDCNPYLGLAASLACGYLGLLEQKLPRPECLGDAYMSADELPYNLGDALDLLDEDEALREVLGLGFCSVYESVKRNEYKEFLQVISPWEREHLLLNV